MMLPPTSSRAILISSMGRGSFSRALAFSVAVVAVILAVALILASGGPPLEAPLPCPTTTLEDTPPCP